MLFKTIKEERKVNKDYVNKDCLSKESLELF